MRSTDHPAYDSSAGVGVGLYFYGCGFLQLSQNGSGWISELWVDSTMLTGVYGFIKPFESYGQNYHYPFGSRQDVIMLA